MQARYKAFIITGLCALCRMEMVMAFILCKGLAGAGEEHHAAGKPVQHPKVLIRHR